MGISETHPVQQIVKTSLATYITEPAMHVSLVGQDNFALQVRP